MIGSMSSNVSLFSLTHRTFNESLSEKSGIPVKLFKFKYNHSSLSNSDIDGIDPEKLLPLR